MTIWQWKLCRTRHICRLQANCQKWKPSNCDNSRLSPLCVNKCRWMSSLRKKVLRQPAWGQGRGCAPSCIYLMWVVSRSLRLKARLQCGQTNAFSPVWWKMWARNCAAWIKACKTISLQKKKITVDNTNFAAKLTFVRFIAGVGAPVSVQRLLGCKLYSALQNQH